MNLTVHPIRSPGQSRFLSEVNVEGTEKLLTRIRSIMSCCGKEFYCALRTVRGGAPATRVERALVSEGFGGISVTLTTMQRRRYSLTPLEVGALTRDSNGVSLKIHVRSAEFTVWVAHVAFLVGDKFVLAVCRCDGLVALRADGIDRGVAIPPSGEQSEGSH